MPPAEDQPRVAEAAAAYAPAAFADLRERVIGFALHRAACPHRVVAFSDEGAPAIGLEVRRRDHSDIRDRWEARRLGRPHPPVRHYWHRYRTYRADDDWNADAIERAIGELEEIERKVRANAELEKSPDPPPRGYEDDYDAQDWLFDLRQGT